MATYEVGETLVWGIEVRTSAGVLAAPGTGPTATVTLPAGTTAAAVVTTVSTGVYTASYVSVSAGRHRVKWSASGANSAGFPSSDVADVLPADPRYIISLDDARGQLNMAASSRSNDDELRGVLAACTAIVEHLVGAVLPATVVESRDGSGRSSIALHEYPAAITTVVENGTTLAATDYYLDSAGILWRGSQPGAGAWSASGRTVVTYTAGASTIPPNVLLAARELVRHLYQQGQQSYRPPAYSAWFDDAGTTMALGYAVPNRVVELLRPSMANRVPGFA